MNENDRRVLRELASEVAEIAALPVQQERMRMWQGLNALRPERPMVLAFPEGAWRELLPESVLQCEDKQLRGWEHGLRATIYHHEHIADDRPIPRFFNIGWARNVSDYGFAVERHRTEAHGSYVWEAPVKSEADLEKLHFPTISIDREKTQRTVDLAKGILGDILDVRVHGSLYWSCGLTWPLINLRGLNQIMMDVIDNPGILHRLMTFLRDAKIYELETYAREGILCLNNGPSDYVGSGGEGGTDELPAPDFDGRVRLKDMWVLGESQEFVGIGPTAFEEFALHYQLPILNRFGLVCYGCCEPLTHKFEMVRRQIPRLRRVSVSPWWDPADAAVKLRDQFIFSWKPNPALICSPRIDYDDIEKVTRDALAAAKGCCVEMIMKDTHTVHNDPERFTKWVQIARRLAEGAS